MKEEDDDERNKLEAIIDDIGIHRDGISETTDKFISLPFVPGINKQLKKYFLKQVYKLYLNQAETCNPYFRTAINQSYPLTAVQAVIEYLVYVGGIILVRQKRANVRFKEHEKAIFKGKKADSALSQHAVDMHAIQGEKVGQRKDKIINREAGKYGTTTAWLNLFEKLNHRLLEYPDG